MYKQNEWEASFSLIKIGFWKIFLLRPDLRDFIHYWFKTNTVLPLVFGLSLVKDFLSKSILGRCAMCMTNAT